MYFHPNHCAFLTLTKCFWTQTSGCECPKSTRNKRIVVLLLITHVSKGFKPSALLLPPKNNIHSNEETFHIRQFSLQPSGEALWVIWLENLLLLNTRIGQHLHFHLNYTTKYIKELQSTLFKLLLLCIHVSFGAASCGWDEPTKGKHQKPNVTGFFIFFCQ